MIRIIIADDNSKVRSYVNKLLDKVTDIEVIGEAQDGQEAVFQTEQLNADILLLDIEMPVMTGIEVLRHLQSEGCRTRILVLSSYTDRELIQGSLELGARGYLFKEEAPLYLISAIRAIFNDHPVWLSQRAAASLFA